MNGPLTRTGTCLCLTLQLLETQRKNWQLLETQGKAAVTRKWKTPWIGELTQSDILILEYSICKKWTSPVVEIFKSEFLFDARKKYKDLRRLLFWVNELHGSGKIERMSKMCENECQHKFWMSEKQVCRSCKRVNNVTLWMLIIEERWHLFDQLAIIHSFANIFEYRSLDISSS